MEFHPAQKALWYEEAAKVLGITPEQISACNPSRVLMKKDLLDILNQLHLDAEARDRLESVLPGPRGRG